MKYLRGGARRRFVGTLLSASLCVGLIGSPIARAQEAQTYESAISAARKSAWQAITTGHGSGMAVAIMDKGKMVYAEGMGVRNWDQNDALDAHTRFNIGSTSKMFAAVAVLLLVDEGKVKLDEPVVTYIPDFTMEDERYKKITVRMLFNHSSGLPGSTFYIATAPALGKSQALTLAVLRRSHLKHDPGAASMYCNDAFTLAEILVERVSKEKFMDFIQERIFKPLAMHDTGKSLGELSGRVDQADYTNAASGKTYPSEVLEVHAAGGLSSTVEDLCRFGNSFTPYGTKILSDASLREIRSPQPTAFSGHLRHRGIWTEFGWDYSNMSPFDAKGIQVLGKGGNTALYSTNLQVLPDQGLVIAACISGNATGEGLTKPILRGLLEDRHLMAREAVSPRKLPAAQPIPADLAKYAGFYAGDGNTVYKIAFDADGQHVTVDPAKTKVEKAGAKPIPSVTLAYHDGVFFADTVLSCYFLTVDGKDYVVSVPSDTGKNISSVYAADYVMLQRLDTLEEPLSLDLDEAGKHWLIRNLPASTMARAAVLVGLASTYEGLDGYQGFSGIHKVEGPTYASMAATHMRDQTELRVRWEDGTLWLESGPDLFSLTAPKKAVSGLNAMTIGADGYNQWLELADESIVRVVRPEGGKVAIVTPDGDLLFDSDVDKDAMLVPEGSLVFCAGAIGDKFSITVE